MNAYDDGGVTVTVHTIEGDTQSLQHKVPVLLITGSTTITAQYSEQTLRSLLVDLDGDTVLDNEVLLDGTIIELVAEPEVPVPEPAAQSSRSGTRISQPQPQVAGATVAILDVSNLTAAEIQQLLTEIMNRLLDLQNSV